MEDDEEIARPLGRHLERAGFGVRHAATGAEALASFRSAPPDVVLLDLRLPDRHGLDVCREIRERSDVALIIVSAACEEADRVAGLELGADDYVVKPFSAAELVERIRAVLRRAYPGPRGPLVAGHLRLDPRARRVTRGGADVELTPREFDLLRLLLERAGAVIRREEIMELLWHPDWFGPTKTLDAHIASLRRKLEADPASPHLIVTIRGVGYRLDPEGSAA